MADGSKIEWTDATWNPVTGCSVVSPGCTNCYAMRLAGTRLRHHPSRAGLTRDSKAGPVWTGDVKLNEDWLTQPLQWRRPRRIFVCAHGDLFHESVPDEWIDRVFAVMALAHQHTFQVLTKRSARMRAWMSIDRDSKVEHIVAAARTLNWFCDCPGDGAYLGNKWPGWPFPNVWLGVTTEDQRRADERIPDLLATPAAVRFVSAEPLLGPLDLTRISCPNGCYPPDYCSRCYPDGGAPTGTLNPLLDGSVDWVIVGGESGPDARAMHPQWARDIRDQCAGEGVLFFFKQWGEWAPSTPEVAGGNPRSGYRALRAHGGAPAKRDEIYPEAGAAFVERVGKSRAGRLLDGIEHNAFPEIAA